MPSSRTGIPVGVGTVDRWIQNLRRSQREHLQLRLPAMIPRRQRRPRRPLPGLGNRLPRARQLLHAQQDLLAQKLRSRALRSRGPRRPLLHSPRPRERRRPAPPRRRLRRPRRLVPSTHRRMRRRPRRRSPRRGPRFRGRRNHGRLFPDPLRCALPCRRWPLPLRPHRFKHPGPLFVQSPCPQSPCPQGPCQRSPCQRSPCPRRP